ncbi:MAG: PIN domain-containing protein [Anaerolineales bacterium]
MQKGWTVMGLILIDSNVLIYAYDVRDQPRQEHAFSVLKTIGSFGNGRLSAQCLSEFFSRTTRGPSPLLSIPEAAQQTTYLSTIFRVHPVTQQIVNEAIRGVLEAHFSYRDAQIWAAARLNQIPVIFSEDFNSGSTIEGVHFVNPFSPDFIMDDWITN